MSMLHGLKSLAEELPLPLARLASNVPFALRLGPVYCRMTALAHKVCSFSVDEYSVWALRRLDHAVRKAYQTSDFYKRLLRACDYDPTKRLTIENFRKLPVLTREDLRKVPKGERITNSRGLLELNTGGTSGTPLVFAVDRSAFAREWAHMHYIWCRSGYKPNHLKLTLRGRRLRAGECFRFNAVHNELAVNSAAPLSEVVDSLLSSQWIGELRWIHGYPSLVAEFAAVLESKGDTALRAVRRSLLGVLLGSEYPADVYRKKIERILTAHVVSWYGHSEMSVLARESARGVYEPLPSYGYTEILEGSSEESDGRLVVTSFYNSVHPFIRYDTGDRVKYAGGPDGCPSFLVSQGRVGDFIEDRNGARHSLTAIIFGRHHAAFELVEHVQVEVIGPGVANLVVVPRADVDPEVIFRSFDLEDLPITWALRCVSHPVRTVSGKIPLKILASSQGEL